MRVLITLVLLAAPLSSVAAPTSPPQNALARQRVDCVAADVRHANKGEPLRPRRLDELPKGELYLSVLRQVDGCQEMVRASEELGRAARR